MKLHLLVIDPQWDFCWPGLAALGFDLNSKEWKLIEPLLRAALGSSLVDEFVGPGKLSVPGAWADMERLGKMVLRLKDKLDDIHCTLDAHRVVDQAHPIWWKDAKTGQMASPFTILGVVNGLVQGLNPAAGMAPTGVEYTTHLPSMLTKGGATGKGSKGYLEALSAAGRYPHVVWPEHCLISTLGGTVVPSLMAAFLAWERQFASVDYVTKGSNSYTEHYSGVQAEVPDPGDPSTLLNGRLIQTLAEADIILLAGEARSHCLANTVRDIAANFSDPRFVEKMVLLTDATSDVPGFESFGETFVKDMVAKGMKLSTTTDILT